MRAQKWSKMLTELIDMTRCKKTPVCNNIFPIWSVYFSHTNAFRWRFLA